MPKMAEGILKLPKLKGCWILEHDHVAVEEETQSNLEEIVRLHRHRQLVVEMIGRSYLR